MKGCSNKSRRQITPCVQVRRLVAATCCGDTSQRQIASCVLQKFCENLCLCNRILSPRQVAQILSDLIFCNMLLRQNSVAETTIFTKILKYTRSYLWLRCVACCCNLSPSVYRPLYESMIIFIGCTTQNFLESIILKEIFHFWFSIKSAIGRIITYDSMNPPPPLKKNP